jgi:hypothetical protein
MMKLVQISERDKVILGACAAGSSIGKKSIADATALFKANEKLGIDGKQADIEKISDVPEPYELEDSELAALKSMFEEGRGGLRQTQIVLKAIINCSSHIEGAVDCDELKQAKADVKKESTSALDA